MKPVIDKLHLTVFFCKAYLFINKLLLLEFKRTTLLQNIYIFFFLKEWAHLSLRNIIMICLKLSFNLIIHVVAELKTCFCHKYTNEKQMQIWAQNNHH